MKTAIPPSVRKIVGERDQHDVRPWYARDLSVDELSTTVAVINAAVRASRR